MRSVQPGQAGPRGRNGRGGRRGWTSCYADKLFDAGPRADSGKPAGETGEMVERVKCPICRVEVAWEGNPFRPFCSDRCRILDLGAWVSERYRIPGEKLDASSEKKDATPEAPGAGLEDDDP